MATRNPQQEERLKHLNALMPHLEEVEVPPVYRPSIDEASPLTLQQLQQRLNAYTIIPPTP
jgi:hypothetical protein